ncbi:mesoderm development candidate 1 [Biomphalaria pfeifferi]|uniref:Mesoderm development candidate 1 n=1 Tax=Biomphalaria pfeifferi TaxID=112525 RepID=A0AAD8C7L3_BIOPF|nr:mesoderm development candidate 1 [Biomphalaria pfeifferi]
MWTFLDGKTQAHIALTIICEWKYSFYSVGQRKIEEELTKNFHLKKNDHQHTESSSWRKQHLDSIHYDE